MLPPLFAHLACAMCRPDPRAFSYKDSQSLIRVRTAVEEILDKDLPLTYAKDLFRLKSDKIFELVFDALLLL
jgi:hypothetical protein